MGGKLHKTHPGCALGTINKNKLDPLCKRSKVKISKNSLIQIQTYSRVLNKNKKFFLKKFLKIEIRMLFLHKNPKIEP
jgi:hypothetical protein